VRLFKPEQPLWTPDCWVDEENGEVVIETSITIPEGLNMPAAENAKLQFILPLAAREALAKRAAAQDPEEDSVYDLLADTLGTAMSEFAMTLILLSGMEAQGAVGTNLAACVVTSSSIGIREQLEDFIAILNETRRLAAQMQEQKPADTPSDA
jgi:hypothetical protein